MNNKKISIKALAAVCGAAFVIGASQPAFAQTSTFTFSPNRPRLVVLIHGVTPKPSESPDQKIGFSGHARHYWGYNFIKGLQGHLEESNMRVITPKVGGSMRFKTTLAADWVPNTTDTSGVDLAPICFPDSFPVNVTPDMENNQTFIKEYIKIMTKSGAVDRTMVMVNTHDGSKHLMPQLAETIEEIYFSYKTAFGSIPEAQQPQIYLVGHSFGGVLARAILANPTGTDLFGNRLSVAQRNMADYLRQRVVLVQTLAAPHEGTLIGDPASDIADYISTTGYNIIYSVMQQYNYYAGLNLTAAQVRARCKEVVQYALDAVSGKRDCLEDLRRMPEYNAGILNPSTARRVDNGPLVPIYTAAGRNPGNTFYDQSRSVFVLGGLTWNPFSMIDLLKYGPRAAKEASALKLIEAVLHLEGYGKQGKKPWGNATNPLGDLVSSPMAGVGPNNARPLNQGWMPTNNTIFGVIDALVGGKQYRTGVGDGEFDNDGFLGWDSAHALNLNSPNIFRVFDPVKYGNMLPWDLDNHGSIMFNPANGAWINNELIRVAGPNVGAAGLRRSIWGPTDNPVTPKASIKVEVLEVSDADNSLDIATQADFTLTVRVGGSEASVNLADNTKTVTNAPAFTMNNYPGSIIPIRIQVIERDTPDPDDVCVISPTPGQSSMYVYFDTRTNRVFGDLNGVAGEIFTTKPTWWGVDNRVNTKIRITRIN